MDVAMSVIVRNKTRARIDDSDQWDFQVIVLLEQCFLRLPYAHSILKADSYLAWDVSTMGSLSDLTGLMY